MLQRREVFVVQAFAVACGQRVSALSAARVIGDCRTIRCCTELSHGFLLRWERRRESTSIASCMPGARPAHYVAGAHAYRLQVAADVSVLTYLF
ncbi:hypothetical protein K788_0009093 [Paraburkholderia caribensis MBA4]|uniref:Uncharacterized protein n=1 Tax=Paraburkholderia caribensis MBA4 TaxID=1323664 RepID=A0A0P0RAT7_9BURK|nr:hypothetical protein K788_0009093 [Paraburkholderia caribensis MBA4]